MVTFETQATTTRVHGLGESFSGLPPVSLLLAFVRVQL